MATLQNTTINSTGFLTIPVGNTTQRPGSPVNGMLRFNTDTGQIEVYNSGATAWGSITGPTISQIQITDSSYNVLDDTAVNTSGGYIKITGTGFGAGAVVVIGSVNATSTTLVNSTTLNVQVPAQVAGTYTVYVVNTNGGTAIGVNGLTYSALPNWVTGSTLPNGQSGSAISIQLNATDATSYALAPANTLPTGLTLTSGGLLSGTVTIGSETTYSFTIIATDAELQDSPRAFTITITVGDPYFYLTTLLLAGNGTNNGTNNTFVDGSTNAFAITRNGNTMQGTFSPFSLTGWSNFFNSTTANLKFASQSPFSIGSGNFTVEMFANFTAWSGTNQRLFIQGSNGTDNLAIGRNSGSNDLFVNIQNSTIISYNWTPTFGVWYHIAVVRSGTSTNQVALYINGVSVATGTSSASIVQNQLFVGGLDWASGYSLQGYCSNFRYSNIARSVVVPTEPYTQDANTLILTCQSNRFIDNSTNNFTITRNGDVSVQSFSPFAPGSSYSTGTVGGSGYFDGSGDWLSFGAQSAFDCGTSTQFCMEAWVYPPTSYPNGIHFWTAHQATVADGFYFTSNGLYVYSGGGGGTGVTTNKTPTIGAWNHCVLTRDAGGRLRYFLNGELTGTSTTSVQVNTDGKAVGINGGVNFTGDACYQSQSRFIKGSIPTTYQTSSTTLNTQIFTPPTAPLTTTSQGAVAANVIALVNYANGQILDSTSKNLLETVGDAKISTAQSKWGGSSMYFDGTTDKLSIPFTNSFLELGINGEQFTLEAWIYPTNAMASAGQILSKGGGTASWSTTNGAQYQFTVSSSSLSWNFNSGGSSISVAGGTVTLNTWQHVAVTYDGTTTKVFLNGVQQGTSTSSYTAPTTRNLQYIGMTQSGGYTQEYYGYINDLRVTKGYARYTTNFTPPSSAFPTL